MLEIDWQGRRREKKKGGFWSFWCLNEWTCIRAYEKWELHDVRIRYSQFNSIWSEVSHGGRLAAAYWWWMARSPFTLFLVHPTLPINEPNSVVRTWREAIVASTVTQREGETGHGRKYHVLFGGTYNFLEIHECWQQFWEDSPVIWASLSDF